MFDNLKKQASEGTDVTHVCQNGNGIISITGMIMM